MKSTINGKWRGRERGPSEGRKKWRKGERERESAGWGGCVKEEALLIFFVCLLFHACIMKPNQSTLLLLGGHFCI